MESIVSEKNTPTFWGKRKIALKTRLYIQKEKSQGYILQIIYTKNVKLIMLFNNHYTIF